MGSRNVNNKQKLPILKNKQLNRQNLPNLPVSEILKVFEDKIRFPVSKNWPPTSTKRNVEKTGKNISTPIKVTPEKPKLILEERIKSQVTKTRPAPSTRRSEEKTGKNISTPIKVTPENPKLLLSQVTKTGPAPSTRRSEEKTGKIISTPTKVKPEKPKLLLEERIKSQVTKTRPAPSTRQSVEKTGKISTPTKVKPEKPKLPCLDSELVLKILWLAEADNLEFKQLILLRSLGKAWRLAIDDLYLPFRYKPASLWTPYIPDKVPEGALAFSTGKHFKFPRDIQLFHEMSKHPHNPFPTRELKIWCQARFIISDDLRTSVDLVADHLCSLTYVVGPSVNSIRLLYDLLGKMPSLKDLRVIEANPEAILKKLLEQSDPIVLPQLDIPTSPSPQLSCLSVTGSDNPSIILDTLLNAFGKSGSLQSWEMQAKAAAKSEFLLRETSSSSYLMNVKKLKLCGADPDSLKIVLREDYRNNDHSYWIRSLFVSSKITDLYLYFDHLSGMEWDKNGARGGRPEIRLYSVHSVRRLGVPYFFALWNCWSFDNCRNVEEIEFHDWAATVNKKRRGSNSVQFQAKEKSEIRSIVSRYRINYALRKVTVHFGKSANANHSLVFQRSELANTYSYW